MAGCGDKKIYQWDSDTGDLVQVCSEAFACCWLAAHQLPAPRTTFSAPSSTSFHAQQRCMLQEAELESSCPSGQLCIILRRLHLYCCYQSSDDMP